MTPPSPFPDRRLPVRRLRRRPGRGQGQAEVRLAQLAGEAHGKVMNFTCETKKPAQPTS